MPTYDFRCPNGHDFEQFFRKISDGTSTMACKVCGAEAERMVSGGAGLLFKGSGFYLTDYGRNAHRKGAEAPSASGEKGGESKPAASGDAGGGAKPAAESAAPKPAPSPKSSSGSSE